MKTLIISFFMGLAGGIVGAVSESGFHLAVCLFAVCLAYLTGLVAGGLSETK